jgi:anti-sigma factor RsiW
MTCTEFLARYTEYRDGLIGAPREARRFARHIANCASCHSFHTALADGVDALQTLHRDEPDSTFKERLARRLAEERVQAGRPHVPSRPALAAALLIAAAIGLLAWESARRNTTVANVPSLPPVPFPKPVAQAGPPFVSFQDPRTSVIAGNPNPYGTAFVEPASAQR